MIDLGVCGFFADFGEADEQMDALYAHGGTGRSMGQRYTMLYKKALSDILEIHVFGEPSGRQMILYDQRRRSRLSAGAESSSWTLLFEAIQRRRVVWMLHGCDRPRQVVVHGQEPAHGQSKLDWDYDQNRRMLRLEVDGRLGGTVRIDTDRP